MAGARLMTHGLILLYYRPTGLSYKFEEPISFNANS
jgi:hypothetical protein